MHTPVEYTTYKRIAPISIAIYWVLWLLLIIWFADITESYPDLDDFVAVLLIINIIWGPFFLGQILSRFRCVVTVKADAIVHIDATARYSLVRDDHPVIMLKDVNEITAGHELFAGNYIALRFRYGHVTKLYAKRYMFSKNPEFFDLFVELKNAWNSIEETEKEKIRTAHEWEGFVGPGPAEEPILAIPVAEAQTVPPVVESRPVPPSAVKVRSAIRNESEPIERAVTQPGKSPSGNTLVIAAIIFSFFLLWVAAQISSVDMPEGLAPVTNMLQTILVLIAVVFLVMIVVSFVKRQKG